MVTLDLFIGRCYAVKYHGKVSLKRCKMAKIINREVVSDSYCENGLDGTDDDDMVIDVAESVEEADFILLHGSEVWRKCRELTSTQSSEDELVDLNFLYNKDFTVIDNLLEKSLQRSLPMVCANPDFIVGLPKGVVGNMVRA